MTHPDREFTEFIDLVQGRQKRVRSQQRLAGERWVDPPRYALQKAYDQETERLRALIRNNERKAS